MRSRSLLLLLPGRVRLILNQELVLRVMLVVEKGEERRHSNKAGVEEEEGGRSG